MNELYRFGSDLVAGTIVDRPNRFLLRVAMAGDTEDVFLGNPGVLSTVYAEGRTVLCEPAEGTDRKTSYTAIAIAVDDFYVIVHTTLANDLFQSILRGAILPSFDAFERYAREPNLPDHGRADFLLEAEGGTRTFVEVKSVTHVEDGIAKFPDSPTERGRRHLGSLRQAVREGHDAHVVFIVQRPDANYFQPYAAIDPAFADLLQAAHREGVHLHALETTFEPPTVWFTGKVLPIQFP